MVFEDVHWIDPTSLDLLDLIVDRVATRTVGEHIADMPPWMGGLPADAPPRRGSPEYDAWMAKRAQEAATPKTDQQQPK
jgi:hypothetical protein